MWVYFGLFPARPVDPTLKYRLRYVDVTQQEHGAKLEMATRQWIESLSTGHDTNMLIVMLKQKLQQISLSN